MPPKGRGGGKTAEFVTLAREVLMTLADNLTAEGPAETGGAWKELAEQIAGKGRELAQAEASGAASRDAVERVFMEWENERRAAVASEREREKAERAREKENGGEDAGEKRARDPTLENKLGDKFDHDSVLRIAKRVKDAAQEISQRVKVDNKNHIVAEILRALHPDAEDDDDDDNGDEVRAVKSGPKESDFKCPVLQSIMTEPMTNGKCPHHIDQQSMALLFKNVAKNGSIGCPVHGCKQQWALASSTLDIDFQRKIARFQKSQAAGGGSVRLPPGTQVQNLADDENFTEFD